MIRAVIVLLFRDSRAALVTRGELGSA